MEFRLVIVTKIPPQFQLSSGNAKPFQLNSTPFGIEVTTSKTLVRRYHNTLFMKGHFMYALLN
jgi:hypothetical protein